MKHEGSKEIFVKFPLNSIESRNTHLVLNNIFFIGPQPKRVRNYSKNTDLKSLFKVKLKTAVFYDIFGISLIKLCPEMSLFYLYWSML